MNFLTIDKTSQGWRIRDSITDTNLHYIGYTLTQAIRRHRINTNTVYKHFTKIYLFER